MIEKLSLLLEDSPSRRQLQETADHTLGKYGEYPSEEALERLGNILLIVQEKAGAPGYETLTCMRDLRASLADDIARAAALCGAAIMSRKRR